MNRQTRATLRRIMARPLARDALGLVACVGLLTLPIATWLARA